MLLKESCFLLCAFGLIQAAAAQAIPKEISGTWVITRQLPTTADSCWTKADARKIIGTEIQYSDKLFRWNKTIIESPAVDARPVTAKQFHDENSGAGPNAPEITLQELGINSDSVTEVTIQHPPSHLFTETTEIPGDDAIMKDSATIVFPVCNIYFEAKRSHTRK